MIHRYSIFVSIGCLYKDRGIEAEILRFACEGFSLILSGPVNITWIKARHMVSYRNASVILPLLR